jgi:hypothetical protein
VIDSIWKSDFGHLDPELFASPNQKPKPKPKAPNQPTWLSATKDFRQIEPDVFTTSIELVAASSIQEESLKKKRMAKDQGVVLAKRR